MSNYDIQIRGKTEVETGSTHIFQTSCPSTTPGLYVRIPAGTITDISASIGTFGGSFSEDKFSYTFATAGQYFFKYIDTGVTPNVRGMLGVYATTPANVISVLRIMSPAFVKMGEEWNSIIGYTYDANNTVSVYAMDPIGAIYDISANAFRYNPSSAVDAYNFRFTFDRPGMYAFYVVIKVTATLVVKSEGWISVYSADWAQNLDTKISTVMKQKTEIERLRNSFTKNIKGA